MGPFEAAGDTEDCQRVLGDRALRHVAADEFPTVQVDHRAVVQTPDAPGIPELRKKELIDRVVAASGMKKRDVKPVVEAMLSVLGDALSKGEALNLQPFGKAKVTRQKPLDNGEVITTRLRRNHARSAPVSTPLAEPAE